MINLTMELGKDDMALSGEIREGFTEEVTLDPWRIRIVSGFVG